MKNYRHVLALAPLSLLMLAEVNAASLSLYSEDFTTGSVGNNLRLFESAADNGWIVDKGTNSGDPSLWQISGGTLNNPATFNPINPNPPDPDARDKPNEGAAGLALAVTTTDTSLTSINFTFDYTVGTGTTLYFHTLGLVNLAVKANPNPQILNTQEIDGRIQPGQRTANYTHISLFDGTESNGATSFAQALTGSGTFSMTYDISAFTSSGTTGITSVADLDFIALAFGANVTDYTGAGAYSIDNISVTAVPEPSSFALFALGSLALLKRRR